MNVCRDPLTNVGYPTHERSDPRHPDRCVRCGDGQPTLNAAVLVEALEEILEIAQEQYDTIDRSDGTPGPNQWMQIGTLIEAALARAEGKLPW